MATAAPEPVIVIGHGPVGQTAALLLARWGLPVVVLDARPERDLVGSKSICQQRDVLDIWDSVGAGRKIAETGVTWTRARTFYQDEELFCQEFSDRGTSYFPPFVNISQCRTEQVLDEQIAGQPLIEVQWGYDVVALEQDEAGVGVTCATAAGPVVVHGSYAVACPGSRGDVLRRLLGVRYEGRSFGDRFLICDIRTDLPGWERERRFYFDPEWNPGRQVLIHPCPDSTYRIDWQVPDDFDLVEAERTGALERRIRSVIGERDYEIVWKSVYRFGSKIADRMRVGRVLLAGDGAHCVAPFGARGLNSGVMDAENAAWKIAFVVNGWAPEDLLDSYHQERHAAAEENLAVTGATMRFLVPQNAEEQKQRLQTLEQARHDDAAKAGVDSGRLAEPFWYVDSPLTTPDPERPFAGRPPKGAAPPPGPGVLMPDLPVRVVGATRLREVLRRGVTVLHGERAGAAVATLAGPGPIEVFAIPQLAPELPDVLGSREDEVWLVRPDAHVAAVLRDPHPAELSRCLDRMLARDRGEDRLTVPTEPRGGSSSG